MLTVSAVAAFAVLVGLGAWQLERLEWKEGLIARIEARTRAEPVPLDEAIARTARTGDIEYLRVTMTGRFVHAKEMHLFSVIKGESGWEIFTPFETAAGRVVLANRGFVPMHLKDAGTRVEGQLTGEQSVTGLVRAPATQGAFTPDNDAAKNAWYWRDLDGMAQSALTGAQRQKLVPFFVELEKTDEPGGWPRGGATRLELPNKHLQYAFTWFGLAGALAGVYAFFVRGLLKRRSFT